MITIGNSDGSETFPLFIYLQIKDLDELASFTHFKLLLISTNVLYIYYNLFKN